MKTVNDFLYDADSPEDGLYHFDQETMQAFLRQYRDECELCPYCDGDGYTSEHDPSDPHENGCTNCPIQVQCDHCEATGILFKPSDMKADPVIEDDNDLPF